MSITKVAWGAESERDIHVLAGQATRNLRDLLFIYDEAVPAGTAAGAYLTAHNTVQLTFKALFKGAPNAIALHVDPTSGVVTVDPALPPLYKKNFIIEVSVFDPADPKHAPAVTETIRVHVHKSVKDVVLTPPSLSVRPTAVPVTNFELTNFRFTVRATFDDDSMGDITTGHGVTWSTPFGTSINFDGRLILSANCTVGSIVPAVATLPAALGGRTATANFTIAAPWSAAPDIPKAKIIPGGGWPGTTLPESAPNVLIMGDGFLDADKTSFETIAASVVGFMKTDKIVRPFDLLCTSMNFWQLLVPAQQRCISIRCEVYFIDAHNVFPIPRPTKPPATGKWSISHLIYRVGLPIQADMGKSPDDLRGDWGALVDDAPTKDMADDDLVNYWKQLGKRGFVDECDSFPGMAFGAPPAANLASDTPMLDLHDGRVGRAGMAPFFAGVMSDSGVTAAPGAALGTLWGFAPFRQDNHAYALGDAIRVGGSKYSFVCTQAGTTTQPAPAGYATAGYPDKVADGTAEFTVRFAFDNTDLIVMITAFVGGRAANYTGYMAVTTTGGTFQIPVNPVSGTSRYTLNMTGVPSEAKGDIVRVVTHELAHSFGLNDEYVDRGNEFPYPFTGAALADYGNLQTLADVQDPVSKLIDGKLIRWNWLRVRKAAVLTGPAVNGSAAGTFDVPVHLSHGLTFETDDIVLLRQRKNGGLIGPASKVVELAKALQVVSRTADTVTIKAAAGGAVALADLQPYTAGSTLFKPVPMPSGMPGPTDPYARMVAKNVENLITSKHAALYLRPATIDDDLRENKEVQHPNLDGLTPSVPGRPFCFKVKPSIVGLYGGGALYASNIFHPTGAACMMRNDNDEAPFCSVCRYIMVEMINPFRHFLIDLDYDDIYPLR
jgi:hypothetical protein